MITPEQFVLGFKNYKQEKQIKFGSIDPNYSTGRPSVIYDSDLETGTLSKALPYLASYTPQSNDRVMIFNGVILGKLI